MTLLEIVDYVNSPGGQKVRSGGNVACGVVDVA